MPPAVFPVQMRFQVTLKKETIEPPAVPGVPEAGGYQRSARRGRISRIPIPRYLVGLGLCFLTVSLTGNILIDVELEGLYHFIFSYLTLPILVLAYGVGWFGLRRWRESVSPLKVGVAPGLVALVILFTCSGVVNYANAWLSHGGLVQFNGPITRLSQSSGRSSHGYYVTLRDYATGQRREFRITHPEYLKLKVGDSYSRTMKQGGLGYAFRWR